MSRIFTDDNAKHETNLAKTRENIEELYQSAIFNLIQWSMGIFVIKLGWACSDLQPLYVIL